MLESRDLDDKAGPRKSLLFDLHRVRGSKVHFEQTYPAGGVDFKDEDYVVSSETRLSLDVYKNRDRYRMVGKLSTSLKLSCCRCTDAFVWPVDLGLDLLYLPESGNLGEGDVEIEKSDLTTAYYCENKIDLGQLMREQFYLALPMKLLCNKECLGLCAVCGMNLNRNRCGCIRAWKDPRWEILNNLKSENIDD